MQTGGEDVACSVLANGLRCSSLHTEVVRAGVDHCIDVDVAIDSLNRRIARRREDSVAQCVGIAAIREGCVVQNQIVTVNEVHLAHIRAQRADSVVHIGQGEIAARFAEQL